MNFELLYFLHCSLKNTYLLVSELCKHFYYSVYNYKKETETVSFKV